MGKKKTKKERRHSKISQHKREGSLLTPPLATLPGTQTASWINERLPEMLWAALLTSQLSRDHALELFRRVAKAGEGSFQPGTDIEVTLSGLAALPETIRARVFAELAADSTALEVLRPLLLLNDLPARDQWSALIKKTPTDEDWDTLAQAVGRNFDHQSQEATDCRWMRILFKLVAGQIKVPTREMAEELLYYPNKGDQRRVRPTIRAMEIGFRSTLSAEASAWSARFWEQCRTDTECVRHEVHVIPDAAPGTSQADIRRIAQALSAHASRTAVTTFPDPRHEGAFGLSAYALFLLDETLRLGNPTTILGRAALRAIFEAMVTLKYLAKRDAPEVWAAYRKYGSGQAKLAFLKLDETESEAAGFADTELVNAIANEDQSIEFLTINLGHWDTSNLRKISEAAGAKSEYDTYYTWTSAYVHGNWAAVRTGAFDICLNPLHRLHRLLRTQSAPLSDVVSDAAKLVNQSLEVLGSLYPPFPERL